MIDLLKMIIMTCNWSIQSK